MRLVIRSISLLALSTLAICLAGGALAAPLGFEPVRAIYVDGDYLSAGVPSDGTQRRPFQTIQEAIELANAEPRISEIHVDRSAQPYVGPVEIVRDDLALLGDNWFESGATLPVIARSDVPTGVTIDINDASYVTVQGFEVEVGVMTGGAAKGTAIRVGFGCSDITLRNLIVTGANPHAGRLTRGILVKSSTRVTIEHCLFADIDHLNPDDQKFIRVIRVDDSDNVTIQNCEFTRIGEVSDDFSFIHLVGVIEVFGGFGNTIRNNLIHDLTFLPVNPDGNGGDPGATRANVELIVGHASEYLTVVNNTIANTDAMGIQTPALIKNLTGIAISQTVHADIRNNLIAHVRWVPGGADRFFAHFQVCYGVPPDPCDPPDPPVVTYSAVTSEWEDDFFPDRMGGDGTFLLDADPAIDPVFRDSANGDYRLAPDSRCVDAGDPLISDPDGSVSDLGCYGGPRGNLPVGLLRPVPSGANTIRAMAPEYVGSSDVEMMGLAP